ncbi:hypothetical protein V8G54_029997 [Vigna mungo]|uniref:AAA+ ATPase domain-containing protein n=1 Tax=Vigna mungo TaxID=3915 RepID=A0AAQ3MVD6_VIGMU
MCAELLGNNSIEAKSFESLDLPTGSVTRLSKSVIQKDLETVHRKHAEQVILPSILDVEDLGPFFHQESIYFAQRLKRVLKDSREKQRNLEAQIRKKMKKFGKEKRSIIYSPHEDVVKGFPEVELKWMFGNKEVVLPKAVGLHLYHGWKKWREEAKANLKQNLIKDAEFGRQYVAERQERILLDRDRVVSRTWYNEQKKRWEMDPVAVPYAVSKKLIEYVRIRHDWGAMYIELKGEDKQFYVDIKEFEMLFEDLGGFDGLYMKMLACDIPTAVHLMWIPFSELNIRQQLLLILRVCNGIVSGLWNSRVVTQAKNWIFTQIKDTTDDIMVVIVFPIVEFLVPYPVRIQLGMAWPEEIYQTVDTTWYLKWQSEAESNFKSRQSTDEDEETSWSFWFFVRASIYGFVLFHVVKFMRRKLPRLLGFGPFRRDPNRRKLRRVKYYIGQKIKKIKQRRKDGVDPIKTAFEQMKRVKKPPIPLKNFASVESMKEEINEVVAFLQNPRAFQEMGAQAPRGVLIVGERGTGKTSLALAIAAEAKVPVVEIKAQQLEAGLWVGQSASNVRELFQTARDLQSWNWTGMAGQPSTGPTSGSVSSKPEAPVIIFVEDFDLFAGVRGTYIHTKNQDHETFINQLLVELDGFEKQDGVVLMATTRNLKQIDEALQRPGRMDRIFHLQRPTQAEREKILYLAAKETMDDQLIDYVDWKKVAEKTALLRPIELKIVPMALEGSAFRGKVLDTDELMGYCGFFAVSICKSGVDRVTVAASKEWTVSGLMHCLTALYTYCMHVCVGDASEVGKRRTRAVFGLHRMEFMSLDNRDFTIRVQQQLWSNCSSDHHEIKVSSRKTQALNVKHLSSISNLQSALQFALDTLMGLVDLEETYEACDLEAHVSSAHRIVLVIQCFCNWIQTFSSMVPSWLRKTKVFNKFSKAMVNHLGLTLTKQDLQNVVDLMEPYGQISNGIEFLSPPLDWTKETKFPHAVWAAGRGLTALLLPNFDVVDNLWLEPQSWQGISTAVVARLSSYLMLASVICQGIGCTKITKARNEGSINGNSESRSYLEKKLVFCFGSYVASQMLLPFGEENLLSISEIQQAQEIATRMVIQYGWGPDDSPAIYYHSNAVTALSMGDDHEYVMADKVEKMFDLAYLKAREMLLKNRPVLEKIVEELLEFEILTGKDLERITKDNGVIREKEPFTLGEIRVSEQCTNLTIVSINVFQPTSVSLLERGNAPGSALLAS